MADHTFFSTENRHNERQIRILSVGSLVSKPPTKEKRISIKVRMPLSTGGIGTGTMGAPAWLDEAYRYVASHGGDKITPDIEFKGYSIDLSTENLFGDDIKSANCIMRGFEIAEFGDEETPDVVLSFTLRMPFSGKKWNYLGQYVGEDVWAKFIPGEAGTAFVESEDGTLLDDGENEQEDEDEADQGDLDQDHQEEGFNPELDTPEELEYESGPALVKTKSGPKDLAAFHEQVVEGEVKRKRGRPRKVPLGFTKPLNQPEF
jgi:hypothetical protein